MSRPRHDSGPVSTLRPGCTPAAPDLPSPAMELAGKVTVVTGGAGGIGSALARRFADEGAAGVVVADRDLDGGTRVAAEIDAAPPGVSLAVSCDVSDDHSTGVLIDSAQATFGPIDLFFANA